MIHLSFSSSLGTSGYRARRPCTRHKLRCQALLQNLVKNFSRQNATWQPQPDLDPAFSSWLLSRGAPSQPMILQDCGVEGRGLVASTPIRAGTKLLNLPESLLITPEVAARESCLSKLLESNPLPEWTILAAYLLELRHKQQEGGAQGTWDAYVRVLPQRPVTLLDWSPKEVRELLQGSSLLHKAEDIIRAADASWLELEPVVRQAEGLGSLPRGVITRASLNWAFGILLSRLVRLPGRSGTQALIPWADFLNHDAQAAEGTHLDWDAESGSVVLVADRDYTPGQQVYASYGPKSSGELLLSYGFCPPPATNPHNAYHLQLGVDTADPLADLKKQLLVKYGLSSSMEVPLRIDGYPSVLVPYLAFVLAKPQVVSETAELAELIFGSGQIPVLDGVDLELEALRELSRRCTAQLKAYRTSMEADRAAAAGAGAGAGQAAAGPAPEPAGGVVGADDVGRSSAVRAALCAGIRVRERQILQRCEFIASSRLKEIRGPASGKGELRRR